MKGKAGYIVVALLVIAVGYLLYDRTGDEEIKFVAMSKIYADSKVKKKYEQELIAFETQSNTELKRMDEEIKLQEIDGLNQESLFQLKNQLQQKRELLTNQYQQKSEELQGKVWNHINSRIEEYGKLKGYKYILGGTGNGAIMYANESDNITEEVLKYVNQ